MTSPRSLVLEPPMTDAELEAFCQLYDVKRVERTREGVIEMNPPTGSYTSDGNSEVTAQLRAWWKTHRRGRVYDSNGGFYLADGSMLSPDASYVTAEKLAGVTKEDRRGFPHICPDFVIKLFSETDRMAKLKQKMERWIENGAQLGWLIDPYRREVHVYGPGGSRLSSEGASVVGEGPVAGFTLDLSEVWSCYEL
jgi:Uma2 family endonuclease